MKEQHNRILKNVQAKHLNDPNAEKVDLNKAEKEYRKLVKTIIYKIKVTHVEPEEVVILQGDPITDQDGEYDEEKANFYIILNGQFKVKNLKFKRKKF